MGTTKRDWTEYNTHRQKELSRFIRESKKVLDRIEPPPGPQLQEGMRGRPPHAPRSVFLANLIRIYFNQTYRGVESLLQTNEQLRRSLGLKSTPGRDTLHRQAKQLTPEYLWRFNEALTAPLKKDWEWLSTRLGSRSASTPKGGSPPGTPPADATS